MNVRVNVSREIVVQKRWVSVFVLAFSKLYLLSSSLNRTFPRDPGLFFQRRGDSFEGNRVFAVLVLFFAPQFTFQFCCQHIYAVFTRQFSGESLVPESSHEMEANERYTHGARQGHRSNEARHN